LFFSCASGALYSLSLSLFSSKEGDSGQQKKKKKKRRETLCALSFLSINIARMAFKEEEGNLE